MTCVLLEERREARPSERSRVLRGGPVGNTRLTALTASVLLVLLAVEGATLLSLRTLISWHILVGMLLVPLVALKLASTGYRFTRYYTRDRVYVGAGPPRLWLRLLGPVVVLSTVGLFGTGVTLAVLGPGPPLVLGLHKASFVVWLGSITLHVLGHLARLPRLAAPDLRGGDGVTGSWWRLALVAGAIAAGAIVLVAGIPLVAPWAHAVGGHH